MNWFFSSSLGSFKGTLSRNSVFVKQRPLESLWSTCI